MNKHIFLWTWITAPKYKFCWKEREEPSVCRFQKKSQCCNMFKQRCCNTFRHPHFSHPLHKTISYDQKLSWYYKIVPKIIKSQFLLFSQAQLQSTLQAIGSTTAESLLDNTKPQATSMSCAKRVAFDPSNREREEMLQGWLQKYPRRWQHFDSGIQKLDCNATCKQHLTVLQPRASAGIFLSIKYQSKHSLW